MADYSHLEGAQIVSEYGKVIGIIARNPFSPGSLANKFDSAGNPFNGESIFNQFGPYGNPASPLSAFNAFTNTPPRIMLKGQLVGYLTKNRFLKNAVDPHELIEWLGRDDLRQAR